MVKLNSAVLLFVLLACTSATDPDAAPSSPPMEPTEPMESAAESPDADAAEAEMEIEREGYLEVGETRSGEPVRLYYRQIGAGDSVVLKPNAVQTGDEIERLAKDRRIVLYDARGRGRSTQHSDALPVSVEHDLEDLEALREHLEVDRVSLMGGSYYGALVALYAARHPDRVDKIVMLGPMTIEQDAWAKFQMDRLGGEVNQALTALLRRGPIDGDLEAFCLEYYDISARNLFADPELAEAYEPDYCDLPNEQPSNLLAWIGDLFATMEGWNFTNEAARVEAPALVVQGLQDAQVPPTGGKVWAEALPNGRLVEVPETGHLPLEESPDVVVPEIEGFLSGT